MVKKRLNQYKGSLNSSQIAAGINSARINSKRFVEDSILLFNEERYPSAVSLAILSIEEAGKVSILRELALYSDEKKLKKKWQEYRSHTKKNILWLLPQLALQGARKLHDFQPLFDNASDHPYLLDQIKQISFYTDCLGNAHWSIPDEVIDMELADKIIQIAKILSTGREVTELEIDLWIKHLGPVWLISNESMNHALENWYSEMQEKELISEGDNEMKAFIRNGIW